MRVNSARGELVLRQVGEHVEIISNGVFLMDTRGGRSERLLVRAALAAATRPRRLLIGGLGVGFSLAAAVTDLQLTDITVVEIEPAVVDWHAGPLAHFSGGALADPRVDIMVADIGEHLRGTTSSYDVICLDVDNGPDWTVTETNRSLYDDSGIELVTSWLAPGGVLAVWSAHPVPDFELRLRRHFDNVSLLTVDVPRGEPDAVYVAAAPSGRVTRG